MASMQLTAVTQYAIQPSITTQISFDTTTNSLGANMTTTAATANRPDGFQIVKDSTYLITGTISFSGATAGYQQCWLEAWYNPNNSITTWEIVASTWHLGTNPFLPRFNPVTILYLQKGARIRMMFWHNNGSALTTQIQSVATTTTPPTLVITPTMPLT